MDAPESKWFHPDELAASEAAFRSADLDGIDTRNDFGSYKILRHGGSVLESQIDQHNDLDPLPKLFLLSRALPFPRVCKYLDIGCGVGRTLEAAVKLWPQAECWGVDVSADAVEYARRKVPEAHFLQMPFQSHSVLPQSFDVITAFEFYPFTRTGNLEFQEGILRALVRALAPGGLLAVYHAAGNPESLDVNIAELRQRNLDLTITRYELPHPRIYKWVRSRFIAKMLTRVASVLLRREVSKHCFCIGVDVPM